MYSKDVPAKKVPNWAELGVKNCYERALKLPDVADYLPDPWG